MAARAKRRTLVRRLATFSAAGTFVIVVASAFLRLSAPHEGCTSWPACYGKVAQSADGTEPGAARRFARLAHRIAATAVAVSILGLAFLCFNRRALLTADGLIALALVVLTGFLALLGRWTPTGALLPAVTLGNLAGGFALLALLWWLRLRHTESDHCQPAPRAAAIAAAAVVLVVATTLLGALVSSNYAALSCPTLPDCNGAWWPSPSLAAFDVFRSLAVDAQQHVQPARYAPFLHMLHRYVAGVAAVVAGGLGLWLLARAPGLRGLGALLLALVALQLVLGVVAISGSLPLAVVVLHNATAAMLLLAGVSASYCLASRLR